MKILVVCFLVAFMAIWVGCGSDSPTIANPEVESSYMSKNSSAEYKAYRIPDVGTVKYFIQVADQYDVQIRDISTDRMRWFAFVSGDPSIWPAFSAAVEMALECREIQ